MLSSRILLKLRSQTLYVSTPSTKVMENWFHREYFYPRRWELGSAYIREISTGEYFFPVTPVFPIGCFVLPRCRWSVKAKINKCMTNWLQKSKPTKSHLFSRTKMVDKKNRQRQVQQTVPVCSEFASLLEAPLQTVAFVHSYGWVSAEFSNDDVAQLGQLEPLEQWHSLVFC